MTTYGNTYNLSAYRVTAESMVSKQGWPMWMFKAFESKSLALSINGQHWELSDREHGTRAIPWGYYLTRVVCGTAISIVPPEVFQDANYTREAENEEALLFSETFAVIDEQLPTQFPPEQSREAWVRDAALQMKCAHIAAGQVGSVSDPIVCVAEATIIYRMAKSAIKDYDANGISKQDRTDETNDGDEDQEPELESTE